MKWRPTIRNLKNPAEVNRFVNSVSELAEQLDVLIATQTPNGNISARLGRLAYYDNSGTDEVWMNKDGGTTWFQVK